MNPARIANLLESWKKNPWQTAKPIVIALAIGIVLISFTSLILYPSSDCQVPAIFNFGDSNSDTGSVSATFQRFNSPYGETFFGKPSGRRSDGRLIIDFLAEKLGLPYLSAYLDSLESNFKHGANFAASGSTIHPADGKLLDAGFNPLCLNIQLSQFQQFKDRTIELNEQDKKLWAKKSLPKPEDFSKALYTFDCGQNDLHFALISITDKKKVVDSISSLINKFALAIEKLYQEGARRFWVHNTGPIGCLPVFVLIYPPKPGNKDKIGCIKSYNSVAQEFNNQLKEKVSKLRTQLPNAQIILVDIYSAKYSLLSEAKKHGFDDPLGLCCGHYGDYRLDCGTNVKLENGSSIYGSSCNNPSKYINWDGIHYTEAANLWVANQIMEGSFSDPPLRLNTTCSL